MCSSSAPSLDEYGVWVLTRAYGTYEEFTLAEMEEKEDELFGTAWEFDVDYGFYCVDDYSFEENNMLWGDMLEESVTGNSWAIEGVGCTEDPDVWRRAQNTVVEPAGSLPDDQWDWPRNVLIAQESLDGGAMEILLAGLGYNDDSDRNDLMSIFQWFPAVCAEKPEDSMLSYIEVCRWEFLYIVVLALANEMPEDEFYWQKELDTTELDAAAQYA